MKDISNWIAQLEEVWRNALGSVITYLPTLLGVILLLLVGWILARLARAGVGKLGDAANRIFDRVLQGRFLARFRFTERMLQITGNAVFWLVVLVFVTAAAKTAKLDAFSVWLDRILAYFPVLLAGGLIIAAGYIASLFVRDVTAAALRTGGFRQSALLARVAQGTVLVTAGVLGIDQIGLDISFLVTIIAIGLASLLGGIAFAFGFGSRDFVANVIAAHNLQHHYKPGQTVQFGEVKGEILELTPTSVIISTSQGRAIVPARQFHDRTSILVTPEDDGG